jgi:hypothetical protein
MVSLLQCGSPFHLQSAVRQVSYKTCAQAHAAITATSLSRPVRMKRALMFGVVPELQQPCTTRC